MATATLKLFLAFGDPKRLRIAELSNWTGKAVAGPRSELEKVLKREESTSPGVYFLTGGKEFFMPYEDFPWFKDAPIGKIINVKEESPGHFYWPDLDVDLGIESIRNPDRFPLKAGAKHP